jgi:hypothetical protein
MYANPDVRRALVLLNAIPPKETIMLYVVARSGGEDKGTASIVRIAEEENAVVFASAGPPAGDASEQISRGHVKPYPIKTHVAHPIDSVRTVYRGADGQWWVVFELL